MQGLEPRNEIRARPTASAFPLLHRPPRHHHHPRPLHGGGAQLQKIGGVAAEDARRLRIYVSEKRALYISSAAAR